MSESFVFPQYCCYRKQNYLTLQCDLIGMKCFGLNGQSYRSSKVWNHKFQFGPQVHLHFVFWFCFCTGVEALTMEHVWHLLWISKQHIYIFSLNLNSKCAFKRLHLKMTHGTIWYSTKPKQVPWNYTADKLGHFYWNQGFYTFYFSKNSLQLILDLIATKALVNVGGHRVVTSQPRQFGARFPYVLGSERYILQLCL